MDIIGCLLGKRACDDGKPQYESLPVDKTAFLDDHTQVSIGLETEIPRAVKLKAHVAENLALLVAALAGTTIWQAALAVDRHHSTTASPSTYVGSEIAQPPSTLAQARAAVAENPEDGRGHFQLGELLRKAGRDREAAEEYLIATSLQRDLFIAYHELSVVCDDNAKLDEAIERLNVDMKAKPRDFMLRVALSELCEKRQDYYNAAKALIDLQYDTGIPQKYSQRVNTRIHFLLTKDKESQQKEAEQPVATDEEAGTVPSPLPEEGLHPGLTAAKMKDSKELKGMGNVPLLP
jgi:tetratricopeptide (TPR) repeat protein